MDNIEKLVSEPIFFERNRVYRVYLGGLPYAEFFGSKDEEGDNMFPEEWVASRVKAINPRYFGKRDGVSVIRGTNIFFDDLLESHADKLLGGRKYDCLVKFLDSAIRLPVQVHPTPAFSKEHFNSSYGKTEAWLVIATRPNAKIFFGFKDKLSVEELSALEERSLSEKNVYENYLSYVDAKVGDVFLIRAGLVHAIGAGCTIIEIQEPTDFTIQPECWCGDYKISENEKYIGLTKNTALSCFNFDLFGEKAVDASRCTPKIEIDTPTHRKENLITYDDTPCFALNRHTITDGSFVMDYAPSVWIVLSGTGKLTNSDYVKNITRGDYFFLPYAAENRFAVSGNCILIECLPSKQG
jgi:Phosphomannose isomerase